MRIQTRRLEKNRQTRRAKRKLAVPAIVPQFSRGVYRKANQSEHGGIHHAGLMRKVPRVDLHTGRCYDRVVPGEHALGIGVMVKENRSVRKKSTDSKSGPSRSKPLRGRDARKETRATEQSIEHTTGRAAPAIPREFPVVGIGASAGGLEALEDLLRHMPADTGMAFVVVTHQHPGHTSLLAELLGKVTTVTVAVAADGMNVEPNHVYVGPPGGHLGILNRTLHRLNAEKEESPRLPIDYFFRSLAQDQKERAICIVLSGTGTDGTLGLKAIKGESGMAMVQQPQSAKYAGMPSSAIATGLADYVLPPAEMPGQLVAYARGPYLTAATLTTQSSLIPEEPMQKIFLLLRSRTGHDFSAYKANTIRRRIERRMNVHHIQQPNQYVRYLQENPHEIDVLFKELLISVTNFFRDPEAWVALAAQLTEMIKARPNNDTLRVWVPGCATGEEAYSLAIVLHECMERNKRDLDVQIFGTDLDNDAIAVARAGRYPDGIAVDVAPERLERYFSREDGTYRIRGEIREMVIFAPQNVIKDPPFTKLDILSCRNLLIYLNGDLQKRLLPIFHYALKPEGLLFLGPSETIGSLTDLFDPLQKRWKIFRRKESVAAIGALPTLPAHAPVAEKRATLPPTGTPVVKAKNLVTLIERLLLESFAPPSLVVNECGDILYVHGHTGAYLEPAQGEPRNNVFAMARQGLEIELASSVRECVRPGTSVASKGIGVKSNGDIVHVDLMVTKIDEPEALRGLLLVTFCTTPPTQTESATSQRPPAPAGKDEHIARLERELQFLRESHQKTLEELETSNEELKGSNEELQSTNEELQSTNEEMETSKEEMQSLNEELSTVNAELQTKVDDLSQANDDMQNLLNSTNIATVFLDGELNVKRFTKQSTELIKLRPTDVARPISELALNLDYQNLVADCQAVLKTLIFKESEVCTKDGAWYIMRIMPYRTADNVIDGLVLTFVDIQRLKAGERAAAFFEGVVNTVREPLVVLDAELRVVTANQSFFRTFQTTAKQTEGAPIHQLGAGQRDVSELRRLLEGVLSTTAVVQDYKVEVDLPQGGRRGFILNARRLEQEAGVRGLILLALEDATGTSSDGEITKR